MSMTSGRAGSYVTLFSWRGRISIGFYAWKNRRIPDRILLVDPESTWVWRMGEPEYTSLHAPGISGEDMGMTPGGTGVYVTVFLGGPGHIRVWRLEQQAYT